MASWNQLVRYVRSAYNIADERPDHLTLLFVTGDDRSQGVHLFHQQLGDGGGDWVQIESAVCEARTDLIESSARAVGDMVCGGVAVIGDVVVVRHAVPLENLDVNEFEQPLALVTSAADLIESMVTDSDEF